MTPAVQWLGRVPYRQAWRHQHLRREGVLAGHAPEVVWMVEHEPVITTGRREAPGVPDAAWLQRRGIDRVRVERGGLATWHGPGQLVGYPILHLERRGLGVRAYVHALEEGVIRWLRGRQIPADRRDGYPGIWVGREKICALGVQVHKGVSIHGFALNLDPDMAGFSLIVPCGISDGGVTSVALQGGGHWAPHQAAQEVGQAVLSAVMEIVPPRR
ncbi:MAG: lipoyl(octanoyl) transferase LipB [Deltaproteobacteria bacterium]|nr:lipoyl(octanoyl) transferase LipB [Deltaproteobacteria bacterium]